MATAIPGRPWRISYTLGQPISIHGGKIDLVTASHVGDLTIGSLSVLMNATK